MFNKTIFCLSKAGIQCKFKLISTAIHSYLNRDSSFNNFTMRLSLLRCKYLVLKENYLF